MPVQAAAGGGLPRYGRLLDMSGSAACLRPVTPIVHGCVGGGLSLLVKYVWDGDATFTSTFTSGIAASCVVSCTAGSCTAASAMIFVVSSSAFSTFRVTPFVSTAFPSTHSRCVSCLASLHGVASLLTSSPGSVTICVGTRSYNYSSAPCHIQRRVCGHVM